MNTKNICSSVSYEYILKIVKHLIDKNLTKNVGKTAFFICSIISAWTRAIKRQLHQTIKSRQDKSSKNKKKLFFAGLQTWRGKAPELDLYNDLKKCFEVSNISNAIFYSLEIMKFDPERQENNINEKDFIL